MLADGSSTADNVGSAMSSIRHCHNADQHLKMSSGAAEAMHSGQQIVPEKSDKRTAKSQSDWLRGSVNYLDSLSGIACS